MVPTLHGFHEPAKKLFFLNVENQYNRVANSFILLSKDIKNIPPVRIISKSKEHFNIHTHRHTLHTQENLK